MDKKPSIKLLDEILDRTIESLKKGKEEIFDIAESARKEAERVRSELENIKAEVAEIIRQVDQMEIINKRARIRLLEVSRDFERYTEEEIKKAYEKAEETLIKLTILREKEENLRQKRNDYERRLINLERTVRKADNLVAQVGVVLDFLLGKLNDISSQVEDLQKRSQLGIRIILAQEEERKRVAREIHDGPAQSIANVVFRTEYVETLLEKDIEMAKAELKELKAQVRDTLQDIRKIIFDLRPMTLDDLGLIPTLRRFIDKFFEKTNIRVELLVIGTERRLDQSIEVTIFRIIQEALNNVYKHARANYALVKIEFQKSLINLVIQDRGVGFNLDKVKEMTRERENYGLLSLEERAELIGGSLRILTAPGKGTTVLVKIPIRRE
ncbi:histidine kinase [Anoxybacter fermentans]|uniref:histidine kinase n=1 Tax=Anoxybacter fermentans TaxID=1323375 RepID=A0A3S9T1P5_9FIRM|nr:sensor histidine kinase [Anoxybacter fermentans]AZR74427.1 histidine kinase [Anoxybacter fermentans]